MEYYGNNDYRDYLAHFGVKGMHWGIRRFQPYSVTGARKGGKTGKEIGLAKRVGDGISGIKKGIKKKITAHKRKASLEKARAAKAEKQEILRSGSAKKMMANKEKFTTEEIEEFMKRAQTETRLAELRKKQSEISFEKADQINEGAKKVVGYLKTANDLFQQGQSLYKNVNDVVDMAKGKEKAINSGDVEKLRQLQDEGRVNSQDLQNALNSIKNRKDLEKTLNGTDNDVERAIASGDPKAILDAWGSMDSSQKQQAQKNAATREWLEKKVSDSADNKKKTDQNSNNTEKKTDQNANASTNEERATPANAVRGTRWDTRNLEYEKASLSTSNNDSGFKPVREARDVTGTNSAFARVMDSRVSGYAESAFSKISDRRASTLAREETTNTGRREATRIISGDTGSKKVSSIILPNSAPKNKPEIILPNSAPKNKARDVTGTNSAFARVMDSRVSGYAESAFSKISDRRASTLAREETTNTGRREATRIISGDTGSKKVSSIILPNSAPKNKPEIILPNSAPKNKPEIILPNGTSRSTNSEANTPIAQPAGSRLKIRRINNAPTNSNESRITFDSASGQVKSAKKAKENADNLADRVNKVNSDSKKKRESKPVTSGGIELTLNPNVDPSSIKKASPKAWTDAAKKRVDSYNATKAQLDRADKFTDELLKKGSDWVKRR